jgi:hypothetical protein
LFFLKKQTYRDAEFFLFKRAEELSQKEFILLFSLLKKEIYINVFFLYFFYFLIKERK